MANLLPKSLRDSFTAYSAKLTQKVLRTAPEAALLIEMDRRNPGKVPGSAYEAFDIVPTAFVQRPVTLQEWEYAINSRKNWHSFYNPYGLMLVYENVLHHLHLHGVMESRILRAINARWKWIGPDGSEEPAAQQLLDGQWFTDFIRYTMESIFWGPTLLDFTDVTFNAQALEIGGSTQTLPKLNSVGLVSRLHVRPVQKTVVRNVFENPTGSGATSYATAPFADWYLQAGKDDDLGLLFRLAPYAVAAKYVFSAWCEFDEKLGIPFRTVKMQGVNADRQRQLADMMRNLGSAGWGILHPGEEMEFVETARNDVHKCFLELLQHINQLISIAVLGQTTTTESAGSLAQAQVHRLVANDRHAADVRYLQATFNDNVLPRLLRMGFPLAGYRLVPDDKEQISITERIKVDNVLLQYYAIDPAHIASAYGIPSEAIQALPRAATGPNPSGDNGNLTPSDPNTNPDAGQGKPNPRNAAPRSGGANGATSLLPIASLLRLSHQAGCCAPSAVQAAAGPELSEDWLRRFYDSPASQDRQYLPDIRRYTQALLTQALNTGMPAKQVNNGYRAFDQHLRLAYQSSIIRFAFAKETAEVLELNRLAKSLPKADFIAAAKQLNKQYNANHLATEVDTAQGRAETASAAYQGIQAGHTHWRWMAIIDDRTRPLHVAYNGKVFPVAGLDSPSFQALPPTEYNCRCKAQFFTPSRKELATLQVEDPAAFLASIPNADKLRQYGFLQNPLQVKDLLGNADSYLIGLDGAPALNARRLQDVTPANQGLRTTEQLRKGKPAFEGFNPTTAQTQAQELFNALARNNGSDGKAARITDYQGDNLYLHETVFNRPVNGSYETFKGVPQTLSTPDEVFMRLEADGSFRLLYLRYYQGHAFRVSIKLNPTGPELSDILGWELLRYEQVTDQIRSGLITYTSY